MISLNCVVCIIYVEAYCACFLKPLNHYFWFKVCHSRSNSYSLFLHNVSQSNRRDENRNNFLLTVAVIMLSYSFSMNCTSVLLNAAASLWTPVAIVSF